MGFKDTVFIDPDHALLLEAKIMHSTLKLNVVFVMRLGKRHFNMRRLMLKVWKGCSCMLSKLWSVEFGLFGASC